MKRRRLGRIREHVGFLPELTPTEPHHSPNEARQVELPVGLNGAIREPARSDFYRFKARKDQRLIFDVVAFRAGSPLDSSLALLDSDGRELVRSEDVNGLDSLIDFEVPEEGEYLLSIRDFRYQGGKEYRYRIVAGERPGWGAYTGTMTATAKGKDVDKKPTVAVKVTSGGDVPDRMSFGGGTLLADENPAARA